MHDNFATNNKLGQPLAAPSSQTLLPVMSGGNGRIVGFYPIALTVFDGTERTFTLSQGQIPITSVTLPRGIDDGTGYGVNQYMAAVFDQPLDAHNRPWLGYSEFVDTDDIGYRMRWYMPTTGPGYVLTRGVLVKALEVAMDSSVFVPNVPVPPDPVDGAIRWAARLGQNSTQYGCGFFDFNWVDLFKLKSGLNPLRLEVVSNPPGGEFKSTLVPWPQAAPLGGIEFNSLRVIRLKDAVAGDYVFNYKVYDDKGQGVPVSMTLTIV